MSQEHVGLNCRELYRKNNKRCMSEIHEQTLLIMADLTTCSVYFHDSLCVQYTI